MKHFARYLSWVWDTSWPLYAATVLLINIIGALSLATFLRLLIPQSDDGLLLTLDTSTITLYGIYFGIAIVVGIFFSLLFFAPVLRWQRRPETYDPNMIRHLVMRIPTLQTILGSLLWMLGVIIFTTVAYRYSVTWGHIVGITASLGGAMVNLFTYLAAERIMRPIAAMALAKSGPDQNRIIPVSHRLMLTWILTSAVPIIGIILLITGQARDYFSDDAWDILPAILALSLSTLITGFLGTILLGTSIVDPIRELQDAMNRVRRGDNSTKIRIYDGSEMGLLQAGFNEMMRGLRERRRVSDLFGQYVGTEVARRAMEEKPTLGGENRMVAALFVDVIGSTSFAVSKEPEYVVKVLNEYFNKVVEVVHDNRGMINKFEGDAALAVFGAPLPLDDIAGHALAAAREIRDALQGMELKVGIGVAAGNVVAGHIGAQDRFEYTIIGDAVNQAARLTDLAKETPGRVLTSAATLRMANEAEQTRWTVMKSVELRGRKELTRLARPIRPTLAEEG